MYISNFLLKESNYSDSYFYNSTVFNYPTINDQKKLAKTIADTLEGSNPTTSKYHKKKQNIRNQIGSGSGNDYESDHQSEASPSYMNYNDQNSRETDEEIYINSSLMQDDSVPDVIKRSIIQASMSNPVRMVQAPDNFKEQHYTEHNTHTQLHPRAAMSLASALQNEISKGGRGAEIFQKRKARSERWVVGEKQDKNANLNSQQYMQQPPPTPQPQPVAQYQKPIQNYNTEVASMARNIESPKNIESAYRLNQETSSLNDAKYSDFNTTPKGWGNSSLGKNYIIYSLNI